MILKVSDAAVDLSAEYLRLFSLEYADICCSFYMIYSLIFRDVWQFISLCYRAYHRASELAAKEHSPIIEVQHLKRIIPGLLLDFR